MTTPSALSDAPAFAGRLRAALNIATTTLLAERNAAGHWPGELSSSALSTATAVTALALSLKHGAASKSQILNLKSQIDCGLQWLERSDNTVYWGFL